MSAVYASRFDVEANHDVERLRRGPISLTQTVSGSHGHLSNDCARVGAKMRAKSLICVLVI